MSLLTKVGSFTKPSATGSQAITGLGFQPKAIIFWTSGSNAAAGTWNNQVAAMLGMTTGAANSYSCFGGASDNVNPTNVTRRAAAKCITMSYQETVSDEADLTSFDADGFTLNWTTATGGAVYGTTVTIMYMAIGGTDIINAKVQNWTGAGSNGNQSVTGVGFKPDLVMHMANGQPATANSTHSRVILGVMNKHGQQWSNSTVSLDGVTPADSARYQQTDSCWAACSNDGVTIAGQAHFVSMDADGFTINWSTFFGAATFSLCLKGVSSKIGAFAKTTAAAPAAQSVSRVGFVPKAVLTSTTFANAAANPNTNALWSLGATDGVSQRATLLEDLDAVTPTVAKSVWVNDATAATMGASAVIDAKGSLTSLDFDGFTLTFNPNSASPGEILYLALGDASVDTFPSLAAI